MRSVTVQVTDDVYRALVNLAVVQHSDVERMVGGAVQALAWGSARPRERRVAEAHGRGLDDGQIGIELGLTRQQIAIIRRDLRLPPNRKGTAA